MADVSLSTVSIALLLAGKVWRNLPAVCRPAVFASPRRRSVNLGYRAQSPEVLVHNGRGRQVDLDGDGRLGEAERIADKKLFFAE
jgi:hypothetical protein